MINRKGIKLMGKQHLIVSKLLLAEKYNYEGLFP
jgi:hypothetical protein